MDLNVEMSSGDALQRLSKVFPDSDHDYLHFVSTTIKNGKFVLESKIRLFLLTLNINKTFKWFPLKLTSMNNELNKIWVRVTENPAFNSLQFDFHDKRLTFITIFHLICILYFFSWQ
jgi:hypothetical protein